MSEINNDKINNVDVPVNKVKKKYQHFTEAQRRYIKDYYHEKTAKTLAEEIGRSVQDVRRLIYRMTESGELISVGKVPKKVKKDDNFNPYINSMSDEQKKLHFMLELRSTAIFKTLDKYLTRDELDLYSEMYVGFMTDPTIETMTTMEKDMLHQWLISEIRMNRYLQEEKESKEAHAKNLKIPIVNRSREIKECQEIIAKCQKSLNVEREQRLKNQNDQSITFTNLIKELQTPNGRMKAGKEAAMFKYIKEKFYNDHLGINIISGKNKKFDIGANFKDGKDPLLSSDFTPRLENKEKVIEDINITNKNGE